MMTMTTAEATPRPPPPPTRMTTEHDNDVTQHQQATNSNTTPLQCPGTKKKGLRDVDNISWATGEFFLYLFHFSLLTMYLNVISYIRQDHHHFYPTATL